MELKGTLAEKNRIYGQIAVSKIDKVLPSIRELTVTQNGVYVVPSDYDGFNPVLVKVPQKTEQEKTVDITENGSLKVMPDEENVLSQVNVNVNVPLRYDEGYSEGYTTGFDEGKNEGFDLGFQRGEASVELQEKTVTENGEVVPDDGYRGFSKVEVNVPLRYEEGYNKGYNKGFDEGKNEGIDIGFQRGEASVTLQEKTVTENGEVIPDEGYKGFSKVNVNVPLRYEEGFDAGYDSGHTEGYLQGYKKGEESVVLQEKTVTENGEYLPDSGYKGFSKISVNVPSTEVDDTDYIGMFITNQIENIESNISGTLGAYSFCENDTVKTISLPNIQYLKERVFYGCSNLTTLLLPGLVGYTYQYMAYGCTNLTTVDIHNTNYLSGYSFYNCSKLARLELDRVTMVSANSFCNCTKLSTLIIRADTVPDLGNNNAFTGTPIAKGTGYIYVPAALVEEYRAAAKWSTYAAQFRAIEDYPDICS